MEFGTFTNSTFDFILLGTCLVHGHTRTLKNQKVICSMISLPQAAPSIFNTFFNHLKYLSFSEKILKNQYVEYCYALLLFFISFYTLSHLLGTNLVHGTFSRNVLKSFLRFSTNPVLRLFTVSMHLRNGLRRLYD